MGTPFLQIASDAGADAEPALLDLFKRQYAFGAGVEQSLRDVDAPTLHELPVKRTANFRQLTL